MSIKFVRLIRDYEVSDGRYFENNRRDNKECNAF